LTEDLRRIVRKLRVERPGGCRDRAALLVGFGAALRRSELIALDLDDITITQAGLTILVRRSKTDQEGQGREWQFSASRRAST
jgi:site-specific recombinase XerC